MSLSPVHRRFPTVLSAGIADLHAIAEAERYPRAEWLTITPFSMHVGSCRQTLIARLSSWYRHHCSRSSEPWLDPLQCPIYRFGSLPGTPRRGHRPGCWLFDINREQAIWKQLRNFSALTPAEHGRLKSLQRGSLSAHTQAAFPVWEQQQCSRRHQGIAAC